MGIYYVRSGGLARLGLVKSHVIYLYLGSVDAFQGFMIVCLFTFPHKATRTTIPFAYTA